MIRDNFKIVMADGATYDMAGDFAVLVRSFRISSPIPNIYTESFEGRNGLVRVGKDFGERSITAVCSFFPVDDADVALLRDELLRVLFTPDQFYVIQEAQPYKRWKVEVASDFTPEVIGTYGEFTIDFVSASSYAESVGTTLDPFTFDTDLWGAGMGLTSDDASYTHSTTSFAVYNASDVVINPREFPLKITYRGASTNLTIRNETTGDEWKYTGTTGVGDRLEINGVRSLKNGVVSVFGNTNRKLITLKPGWNQFTVTGAEGAFSVEFDFRFYYL
ncbi:phage tail family protein [Mesobacillus zeae]|uniref:phage tail family protein n=1 Tax=Mesobacillus zeae TaxID=1917180 RepID=UPI003009AF55